MRRCSSACSAPTRSAPPPLRASPTWRRTCAGAWGAPSGCASRPRSSSATTRALGRETDPDDLEGATVREAALPTDDAIAEAVAQLTGALEQIPPAYSAKRIAGRRAYEAARAGETLTLAPASVRVFAWREVARDGASLRATIACGGGTYIRALARDLGRLTGSAAHLAAL